jgi:hypothetical protein
MKGEKEGRRKLMEREKGGKKGEREAGRKERGR